MRKKEYITIPQAAKLLGISRIAVYRKVKKGQIKAQKIGRCFIIKRDSIIRTLSLGESELQRLDEAIQKALSEYGETFRLLGRE